MTQFTAQQVQKLRKDTNVGMMDAKKALTESEGDYEKAKDYLREKGLADAKKRADRDANQGTIGMYVHRQFDRPVMGVFVELSSETDFVAKSSEFQEVADDIAMHIAAMAPRWVAKEAVPADALDKERDLIARQAAHEGKPETIIPKIVEGKINSFYEDNVLYEQTFVNAEKFDGTVGELVARLAARMGENIGVKRFARIAVGEQET
ncbi:MAG TPA: translation elongation factor Ts [Acidimicrobiia bacterium]|nr:translation elongation factor Ts [Acidimicrobiia bacterium]